MVCDGGDFSQTVNDHHFYQTHGETLANGLKAGVDCFTDDGEIVYAAAREALDNGWITEKDIDESVRNSFRTRIRPVSYTHLRAEAEWKKQCMN